jgi:hypothetical protein
MNLAIILQIIDFFLQHRAELGKLVMALETLAEGVAGPEKGAVLRDFVAKALGIEAQVEAVWEDVQPMVNLFVAATKKKAATPAS